MNELFAFHHEVPIVRARQGVPSGEDFVVFHLPKYFFLMRVLHFKFELEKIFQTNSMLMVMY